MKIAIINKHRNDLLGGSEIQCDIIARGLAMRGHEVVYLAADSQGTDYAEPYRVIPCGGQSGRSIQQCIIDANPDVVYWRHNKAGLLKTALTCRARGIPLVYALSNRNDLSASANGGSWTSAALGRGGEGVTLRSLLLTSRDAVASALNSLAVRFLIRAVVTLNSDLLPNVKAPYAVAIPNSMFEDFVPFKWPRPFCVWVANLKPTKRPELFIELARRLSPGPLDFLIVGRADNPACRPVLDRGLREVSGLHYLGARSPEEVNGILREARYLVHTGQPEGFGNNLIQAWLQGAPTLTLIHDPEGIIAANGLGAVAGTFDELCASAEHLSSETVRAAISVKAIEFARGRFSASKNIAALDEFLGVVLLGHRRRSRSQLGS